MIALDDEFLVGSYPPLVTPFLDGAVDYDGYASLVEYQVRSGSHGVVVCGTTGEPTTLTVAERRRLLEVAVHASSGRVPVVAATGSQSHAETVALTEHAARAGAAAVLVVTPFFLRPPPRGLAAYFIDIGARCDLPLLLYHIPGRAAVGVDLGTLETIANAVPHFVGMKHAVDDLALVSDVLACFGASFRVLVGLEELSFPMLALGASGMVNAVANVAPERVAQLAEVMRKGDLEAGRRLHFELLDLNRSVFLETNPVPTKYMMRRLGILSTNEHRLPLVPASPETEARCDQVLRAAGLLAE